MSLIEREDDAPAAGEAAIGGSPAGTVSTTDTLSSMSSVDLSGSSGGAAASVQPYGCFRDRRMWNVVVMGVAFMLIFTGYNGVQNLLTSVLHDLGYWSLATVYSGFALTSLVAPYAATRIGLRKMMAFGATGYFLFCLCCVFQTAASVMIGSTLLGVAAAVLWTAQGAMLVLNSDPDTMSANSGLFFGLFLSSYVVGFATQGVLFALDFSVTTVFIIMTVICGSGGAFLITGMVPTPRRVGVDSRLERRPLGAMVREVLQLLTVKRMALALPIMIYQGSFLSFIIGTLPPVIHDKETIGFAMATFGVFQGLGSFVSGRLSNRLGRRAIMVSVYALELLALFLCFFVGPERKGLFYVVLSMAGWADAALHALIYAIIETYFTDRVTRAMAALQFTRALAVAIFSISSKFLDLTAILVLLIIFLNAAVISLQYAHSRVQSIEAKKDDDAVVDDVQLKSLAHGDDRL